MTPQVSDLGALLGRDPIDVVPGRVILVGRSSRRLMVEELVHRLTAPDGQVDWVLVDVGWPWRHRRALSVRPLVVLEDADRALAPLGVRLESCYLLWPSASEPRVIIPTETRHVFTWLLSAGKLGGGRRPLVRRILRNRAIAPLMWRVAPGAVARVVRC